MIKLYTLELQNFMCISHAILNFDDSKVILLIGENGNGKSSILDAVSLCLTESKRADTFKDYVKYGTDTGKIFLDASIDGEKISFSITLNANTTPNMERLVRYQNREYRNSEVTALLGRLNIATYADIIMSAQNEGDITKLTPTKRGEYLKSLLSFDFTSQVDTCKEKIEEIKKNIDYNTHQIVFNNNSIKSKLSERREVEPCSYTPEQLKELEDDIVKLSADSRAYSISLRKKDELVKEITSLRQSIFDLQQKIDNEVHNKDTTEVSINLIKDSVKELDSLKEGLTLNQSKYNTVKNTLDAIDDKPLNSSKDEALQKYTLASSDKKHAEQHLALIEKGICPECGHNFDDSDVSKYNNMFNEATVKEQEYKEKVDIISKELLQMNNNKEELNKQLYSLKAGIDLNTKRIQELESKAANIPTMEASLSKFDEMISSLKQEKAIKDSDLSTKQTALGELEASLKVLTESSNTLKQKMALLARMKEAISNNEFIIENNKRIQESIDSLQDEIKRCEESLEGQRKEKAMYDEALEVLQKNFPNYLVIKTCEKLEAEMNNFIQVVFPSMEVKLFQSKKGVEFFYTLDKDDGIMHIKQNLISVKMASGFEKAVISLAFKVSLCRAYGMTFSFLDEVDSAGSEKNSENLFKSLIVNDWFEQLFIISHKPAVRDSICSIVDAKTYYVRKGEFSLDE